MPVLSPVKRSRIVLISDVKMSQYGYWIVSVSLSPGRSVGVMIVMQGVPPDKACQAALESLGLSGNAGKEAL